jgi:hypothetical protein
MKLSKNIQRIGLICLVILMLILPGLFLIFSNPNNHVISTNLKTGDSGNDITQFQRSSRGGDLIVNGTQELTITGTQSNTSIWVKDSAKLIIDDAILTVTQGGRFNVTDNAEIVIKGDSSVLCQWGTFKAHCKSFLIDNSSFQVTNGSDPDSLEGFDASISIITTDDISITNSDIRSEAGDGRTANENYPKGGLGGESSIYIESDGSITIRDKKAFGIKSEGGLGGTGYTSSGGKGGDSELTLISIDTITITDAELTAIGGRGGKKDTLFGKEAGNGGNAFVDFNAYEGKSLINVKNSDIISEEGSKGQGANTAMDGISIVKFKCWKLAIDKHKKTESTPSNPESKIRGKEGIDVESKLQDYTAEFFVVNTIGENNERKIPSPPLGDTNTMIKLYWWLTVNVQDESGAVIEGANVTISGEPGVELLKSKDLTDSTGNAYFLLYCRDPKSPQSKLDYTIIASKSGAEHSVSTQINDNNQELTIKLKLVTVDITSVMGLPAKANMTVGGVATVEGTALPASGESTIISVTIQTGTGNFVNVIDTSGDFTFSTWKYDWYSTTIASGTKVTLTVIATSDDLYEARTTLMVKVDHEVVNDAPIIKVRYPLNNSFVNSSSQNKVITIYGDVDDFDYDSDQLSQGKNVSEVYLLIRDGNGNIIYSQTDYIDPIGDWDALNYTWKWSFDWDVWELVAGEYKYPNGNYTLTIYAKDDGGLYSTSEVLNILLNHLIYPVAVISKIEFDDDGKRTEVKVDITQAGTVGTYIIDAPEGDNKIKIYFDGEGSYDIDGKNRKPSYYLWQFDEFTNSPWDANATISYEYILVAKDTKDDKILRYDVKLRVRDSDNLQNQIFMVKKGDGSTVQVTSVELVINYRPPAEKSTGIFWPILGLETKDSTEFVRIIFILPLIILNAVAAAVLFRNKRVVAKKRKAREESMMARIEKEQAEEEQKAAGYLDEPGTTSATTTTTPPAHPPSAAPATAAPATATTAAAPAAAAAQPAAAAAVPAAVPAVSAPPPVPGELVVGKLCESCGTEVSMDSRMDKCPQCGGKFIVRV